MKKVIALCLSLLITTNVFASNYANELLLELTTESISPYLDLLGERTNEDHTFTMPEALQADMEKVNFMGKIGSVFYGLRPQISSTRLSTMDWVSNESYEEEEFEKYLSLLAEAYFQSEYEQKAVDRMSEDTYIFDLDKWDVFCWQDGEGKINIEWQLGDTQERIKQLEITVSALNQEVASVTKENKALKKENERLQAEVERLEKELEKKSEKKATDESTGAEGQSEEQPEGQAPQETETPQEGQQAQTGQEPTPSQAPDGEQAAQPAVVEYRDVVTIRLVQETLNKLGYNCGTADGIMGTMTKNAITAYQQAAGITVNGLVTDELIASLGIAEAVIQAVEFERTKAEYVSEYTYSELKASVDSFVGTKLRVAGTVKQSEAGVALVEAATAPTALSIPEEGQEPAESPVFYVQYPEEMVLAVGEAVTVYGVVSGLQEYPTLSGNVTAVPKIDAVAVER